MDWMLLFFRCGRLFGFPSCHFQLQPPQLSPSPLIASLFCVALAVRSLSGYCLLLILTLTFFKFVKQIYQQAQKNNLLWLAFVKYIFLLPQLQYSRFLRACKDWWGGTPRASLGSETLVSKPDHPCLRSDCANPLWNHLQFSAETYNNNARFVCN